jgi:hypothetical protein
MKAINSQWFSVAVDESTENSKKVLQSLNIPIQELRGLMKDGAPSMVWGSDLIMRHCLIFQENFCAKFIKITDMIL